MLEDSSLNHIQPTKMTTTIRELKKLLQNEDGDWEVYAKDKDGNRIQVDLCIAPVKTEERKVVGLSCLFG